MRISVEKYNRLISVRHASFSWYGGRGIDVCVPQNSRTWYLLLQRDPISPIPSAPKPDATAETQNQGCQTTGVRVRTPKLGNTVSTITGHRSETWRQPTLRRKSTRRTN